MKVNVYKVRENAKLPVRAHPTDAGMDLFFCPEADEPVTVRGSRTCLLQTGLKIEVPEGYMLEVKNKSGIASKKQLVTGACVVDSGYDGEIFVNLHNIGERAQVVQPGQKIAQGVFVKVEQPLLVEIEEDNIYGGTTKRGSGALGSTGDF
tara:strand:- start:2070 stop:2519 length:450 start_codon:yes stop_codon:yes gene_type:complete